MKTDWKKYFEDVAKAEAKEIPGIPMVCEEIYQAFKARLLEELGVKILLEWNTENGVLQEYTLYDKTAE